MQKRILTSIAATFSLVLGIQWPVAAQAAEKDHSGPYLGIGVGFGFQNWDIPDSVDVDPGYGFDAWGGYKFNKWVATELQLEYLNGFEVDPFGIKFQSVTFGGNLKVFPLAFVLADRIQPFVMAGPGFTWLDLIDASDVNELDFSARFGGGIDFYVTDNVALQVSSSYVLTTGDIDGSDYISLVAGVQYKF
jgi:opacity protein-like surface antigen